MTFLTLSLYRDSQACLIMVLEAFLCTMNTRVLLSSMVLMAASVPRGFWITLYWSKVLVGLTALRAILADLFWTEVLGLLKVVLVQILVFLAVCVPFLTAVDALLACYK